MDEPLKQEFRVDFLPRVGPKIQELFEVAKRLGIAQSYRDALHTIVAKLRADPFGWGNPYGNLILPGGVLSYAVVPPVTVYFSIFTVQRIVTLTNVQLFLPPSDVGE